MRRREGLSCLWEGVLQVDSRVAKQEPEEPAFVNSPADGLLLTDAAILEHLPVVAFTATTSGYIHLVTPHAGERAGVVLPEGNFAAWVRRIHPGDRRRVATMWREALAHGVGFHQDFRLRLRDGSYRWF